MRVDKCVRQANVSDGWNTDPFKLVLDKETGKMFGRGSTDDKGPIMGWLNVLEAHHKLNLPLPVNMRFCFEGMEESGSEGLDEFILEEVKKQDSWFKGVDAVCIVSDRSIVLDVLVLTTGYSPTTTGLTPVHHA